jgi:hypothetical protein
MRLKSVYCIRGNSNSFADEDAEIRKWVVT